MFQTVNGLVYHAGIWMWKKLLRSARLNCSVSAVLYAYADTSVIMRHADDISRFMFRIDTFVKPVGSTPRTGQFGIHLREVRSFSQLR